MAVQAKRGRDGALRRQRRVAAPANPRWERRRQFIPPAVAPLRASGDIAARCPYPRVALAPRSRIGGPLRPVAGPLREAAWFRVTGRPAACRPRRPSA